MESKINERKSMVLDPWPDDIAKTLAMFAGEDGNAEVVDDLTNAIYHLKADAENEYNSDEWRTLYDVLLVIADKHPAELPF